MKKLAALPLRCAACGSRTDGLGRTFNWPADIEQWLTGSVENALELQRQAPEEWITIIERPSEG